MVVMVMVWWAAMKCFCSDRCRVVRMKGLASVGSQFRLAWSNRKSDNQSIFAWLTSKSNDSQFYAICGDVRKISVDAEFWFADGKSKQKIDSFGDQQIYSILLLHLERTVTLDSKTKRNVMYNSAHHGRKMPGVWAAASSWIPISPISKLNYLSLRVLSKVLWTGAQTVCEPFVVIRRWRKDFLQTHTRHCHPAVQSSMLVFHFQSLKKVTFAHALPDLLRSLTVRKHTSAQMAMELSYVPLEVPQLWWSERPLMALKSSIAFGQT